MSSSHNHIVIRGAREHNLKNISLNIPKHQIVVVTGVSGSGKSSLVFDTVFAEGQRRFVESLSAYARQFLGMLSKPDVEQIDGLSPAIAIEQKTASHNPRSTVGTVTEIYDYMRLLWARIGIPVSPKTGLPIVAQTFSQMADRILSLPEGTKAYLVSPVYRKKDQRLKDFVAEFQRQGFTRVVLNGVVHTIDQLPEDRSSQESELGIVIDRVIVTQSLRQRVIDSLEVGAKVSGGQIYVVPHDDSFERFTLNANNTCPVSGFTIPKLEPKLFSFNSPEGACPACSGLGYELHLDVNRFVINPNAALNDSALALSNLHPHHKAQLIFILHKILDRLSIARNTPWALLPEEVRRALLCGCSTLSETELYAMLTPSLKSFEGIKAYLLKRYENTEPDHKKPSLETILMKQSCSACEGLRLKPEALCVHVNGKTIAGLTQASIAEAQEWFLDLSPKLTEREQNIAKSILREIGSRLAFLSNVGLAYLTLSRTSATLSGGESQRIRLASQIGSGLSGVLYVLDEPSIGLHPHDTQKLLATLTHLKTLGNSLIIVEHDEDTLRHADTLIEIGPGAGQYGGELIAQAPYEAFLHAPRSLTAKYLRGDLQAYSDPTSNLDNPLKGACLNLLQAHGHNLQHIDVCIPLGVLTCVTGVSGSGKSTLINETLVPAVSQHLGLHHDTQPKYGHLSGTERIDRLINIDQSPIGRTPRSNAATYTGIFTYIRKFFADLPEAKLRGFGPSRFSFNLKGGRCEACQGEGVNLIEMHFLSDIYVRCDVCNGKRFNEATLGVTYKSFTISDVLNMSVDQAMELFQSIPLISERLKVLQKVGLGYIHIGQPATQLSGGEAQRIKLSKELAKRSLGHTLYVLDEPTSGLHMHDVKKLIHILKDLSRLGHTVILIEHNVDVIRSCDWIIDLGPGGGTHGGKLVACGTPRSLSQNPDSLTGRALAKHYVLHPQKIA